jgi:hypothetical protein
MENTTISHKYLKLVTGDELVAAVHISDDDPSTIVLESPMRLMFLPDHSTGSLASFYVTLGPWIPCSNEELFTIDTKNILVMCGVSSDMINQYNLSSKKRLGKLIEPDKAEELVEKESNAADKRIMNLLDGLSQLEALSDLEDYDTSTGVTIMPNKKGKKLLN